MGGTTRISEDVVSTLTLQSSAYGLTVPIVGGVFKVGGNLVDYLDFKSEAHTEEQGGKGGGVESTTYTYSVSLLMGLGMGRLNVGRVFKGKEALGETFGSMARQADTFTVPASGAMTVSMPNGHYMIGDAFVTYTSGGKVAVLSSGVDYKVEGSTLTILLDKWRGKALTYGFSVSNWTQGGLTNLGLSLKMGDIAQTPPSWIAASSLPDHSQNYPGLAYVHGEDYALGNSTQVENHLFEVAGFGAGRYFATAPLSAKLDCNTAEFVAWVLSAADFGAGVPAERLDVKAWIDYVAAAGLLSSPALTTATKAADLLKRACDLTNTVAVPSYDRIKLLPLCDVEVTGNGVTYTPDNTIRFDVNADWIIGEVEISRKQKSDRFNHFRVEYKDRGSQYAPAIAEAMDDEDIALNGKRTGDTINAPWVCSADVARLIAQIALQRSMQVNTTGRVVLPFAFSMLEPGDLITITDPRRGLDRLPVRVTATSDNGRRVTVEFEEWPLGVASPAQYQQEVPAGFLHDYSAAPGNVSPPVIFEGPAQLASPTGVEVYVAVRGASPVWGGAHVFVSYDGTQYKQIGTVYGSNRYGLINGAVSSGATSFAVDGLGSAQLLNGSADDALNLETLCYLGGVNPEFLAYQTATLTGAGAYTLSGLVRGAYGSGARAHADNVPFVRMDGTTARSGALSPDLIGQTIYIKCLSFNIYNRATQSLADATAYTYTITGKPAAYMPGIAGKGLTAKSSSLTFTLQKAGGVTPSVVTLTAERKGGLEGVVNWSVVSGTATLSASTGDSVTLSAGNLATDLATVRATVTDSVASYTSDVTISKVREGEDGSGNITWTTRGGVVMNGTTATKTSGANEWDGEVATVQGFAGGCYVSCTPAQTNKGFMFGLNADPTSAPDYQSIDFAMYVHWNGNIYLFESGTQVQVCGPYSTSSRLEIRHSGGFVRYYQDGDVLRSVALADSTVLYADASFYEIGAAANNLVFGPVGAKGAQGDQGPAGYNGATVTIYKRGATEPSGPTATVTYTFATKTLAGLDSGWSIGWPPGDGPVWARVASFSSQGATDTAAANEWTAPQIVSQNGIDGEDGLTVATVYLYQRTSTATPPSLPSANVTYTFATGGISGANNGWVASLPATGGSYRWVTQATAAGTGATELIGPSEWAAAALIAQDGADGADGADGNYIDYRFKRSATAPSTPTGDAPAGWSDGPPAGTDPLYFIKGSKTAAGVLIGAWSTPARLDGDSAYAEFSVDGSTSWHTPATGADKYMRTRTGDGAWQGPFKIVAEEAGPVPRSLPKVFGEHYAINPATATAGIRFTTDGRIQTRTGATWSNRVNWYSPTTSGVGSGWHIRRTHISGTVPSGGGTMTAGTWHALTSDRDVVLSQTADGTTTCNELFELSNDGGTTIYSAGDGIVTVTRATEA